MPVTEFTLELQIVYFQGSFTPNLWLMSNYCALHKIAFAL